MRGRTCYGSEVFGDTYQRSIVFAHAFLFISTITNINRNNMKSLLVLTLMAILSIQPTLSQVTTKIEGIYHKMEGENSCRHIAYLLGASIIYDSSMNPQRYIFEFSAQNSNYNCLSDLFVLKNGTAKDIYDLLMKIEDFGKQVKENGVSIEYENCKLTRWDFGMLGKRIAIKIDDKYHAFKDKDITKIKKKLIKYCEERNIDLK